MPCMYHTKFKSSELIDLSRYGVTAGAEALATSVASGVEGVVVSFPLFDAYLLTWVFH